MKLFLSSQINYEIQLFMSHAGRLSFQLSLKLQTSITIPQYILLEMVDTPVIASKRQIMSGILILPNKFQIFYFF